MRFRGVAGATLLHASCILRHGAGNIPLPLLFDWIEASLSRVGRTINVSNTEAEYAHVRLAFRENVSCLSQTGSTARDFALQPRKRVRRFAKVSVFLGTRLFLAQSPDTATKKIL